VQALRQAGVVVVDTLRLALGHGPTVLTVLLLGVGVHELVLAAAIRVSVLQGTAGLLLLLLAPVAVLASFVVGLRVMAPSLRGAAPMTVAAGGTVAGDGDAGDGPVRRSLAAMSRGLADVGSLIIPFVAVYELSGYVHEDVRRYAYGVALDSTEAIFETGTAASARGDGAARLGLENAYVVVGVAVAAFVLRRLLVRAGAEGRRPWLALPAAYVEIVWLSIVLIVAVRTVRSAVGDWLLERQVGVWVESAGTAAADFLGPVGPLAGSVTTWVLGGLASVDRVLLLPLSWLTVAAVVHGRRLGPGEHAGDAAEVGRYARTRRAISSRFEGLLLAVRHLRHLGLVPGLAYCLGFLLVWSSQGLLWELERVVIGPQPLTVWREVSGPLDVANRAVALLLLLCFVAAAADRMIMTTQAPAASGRRTSVAG
jgi:hypothetical protein